MRELVGGGGGGAARGRKGESGGAGVCLAVTLSEARGAEQPNYDLRPVL